MKGHLRRFGIVPVAEGLADDDLKDISIFTRAVLQASGLS